MFQMKYVNLFGILKNILMAKKTKKTLEVHGRARREAARRRKSEWKVNLDIRNSSRSNGSWRMST